MMDKEGAGAGDDSGQAGNGAPAGGSPEGGSENDDKPISARQLKAALASQEKRFKDELAAKERELEAFKAGLDKGRPPADKPKVYSKPELKAAVDGGQITQEQADDIWDKQREAQIRESAKADALSAVNDRSTKERIDRDISRYKQLKPEIMERGSDVREKIAAEYQYLREAGSPESIATELVAIRAVLGPLEKLEKAADTRRAAESHQESGGGGEGGDKKGGNSGGKKLVDHLKGDAKEYYEKGIKSGRYPKGWDDVEAELKYASPGVKRRLGLPA